MALFCGMVEDCWDPDPDARLTAERIYDRITQLTQQSGCDIAPDLALFLDRDPQKGSFEDNISEIGV